MQARSWLLILTHTSMWWCRHAVGILLITQGSCGNRCMRRTVPHEFPSSRSREEGKKAVTQSSGRASYQKTLRLLTILIRKCCQNWGLGLGELEASCYRLALFVCFTISRTHLKSRFGAACGSSQLLCQDWGGGSRRSSLLLEHILGNKRPVLECVCVCVVYIYLCVLYVCLVLSKARRECQFPWNYSNSQFTCKQGNLMDSNPGFILHSCN